MFIFEIKALAFNHGSRSNRLYWTVTWVSHRRFGFVLPKIVIFYHFHPCHSFILW